MIWNIILPTTIKILIGKLISIFLICVKGDSTLLVLLYHKKSEFRILLSLPVEGKRPGSGYAKSPETFTAWVIPE